MYVVVNWKFILPEMSLHFYRAAGSHGMLVMVNTANESVQVKVPMEHAGKTMTDVIAGVDVELPTVMTMEPYQYFIYPTITDVYETCIINSCISWELLVWRWHTNCYLPMGI